MPEDRNSYRHILRRVKRASGIQDVLIAMINVIVNIWYSLLINMQKIFFNYFAAFLSLVVQYVGVQYMTQLDQ